MAPSARASIRPPATAFSIRRVSRSPGPGPLTHRSPAARTARGSAASARRCRPRCKPRPDMRGWNGSSSRPASFVSAVAHLVRKSSIDGVDQPPVGGGQRVQNALALITSRMVGGVRERLDGCDDGRQRLVGKIAQPVAATQHRQPGQHRFDVGLERAPRPGRGHRLLHQRATLGIAGDDADPHRAPPFVERIEYVGLAELHAHGPPTGTLPVVPLEVAGRYPPRPRSKGRPAPPSSSRVRTPGRRS